MNHICYSFHFDQTSFITNSIMMSQTFVRNFVVVKWIHLVFFERTTFYILYFQFAETICANLSDYGHCHCWICSVSSVSLWLDLFCQHNCLSDLSFHLVWWSPSGPTSSCTMWLGGREQTVKHNRYTIIHISVTTWQQLYQQSCDSIKNRAINHV